MRPLNPAEIVAHWATLKYACCARQEIPARILLAEAADRAHTAMAAVLRHGVPEAFTVQPHAAVQSAIRNSASVEQVVLVSEFAHPVATELLALCGYSDDARVTFLQLPASRSAESDSLEDSAHLPSRPQLRPYDELQKQCTPEFGRAADLETHVLMDTLQSLRSVESMWLHSCSYETTMCGPDTSWTQNVASAASTQIGSSVDVHSELITAAEDSSCGNSPAQLKLHLCEWGRCTASMQASAAANPSVQVVSSAQLAELLDVSHMDEVMDGVAWR